MAEGIKSRDQFIRRSLDRRRCVRRIDQRGGMLTEAQTVLALLSHVRDELNRSDGRHHAHHPPIHRQQQEEGGPRFPIHIRSSGVMMEYKPTFLPATARTRLQTAAHRCYRYNGTCGGTTRRLGTVEHAQSQVPWPDALARIIHERFCCNRRSAATTGLRSAGSPLGSSPYCTSTHWVLTAPHAGLATRLSDFATNFHE